MLAHFGTNLPDLKKQYHHPTTSPFVSVCVCVCVCAPCTLFAVVLSTYTHLDDGILPTFSFTPPPRGGTASWPLSPPRSLYLPRSFSTRPKKHLVLIRMKLYSLAFVSTPFTSALVFYSESNVLTKAACRGRFP